MEKKTTTAETLTAQWVRLREERAGQAETLAGIKGKVTAALTTGGGGSVVDALLSDQGDAERKLAALDTAIAKVLSDLPAVRAAEADAAAARHVTTLIDEREHLMDHEVPEAAERRSRAAHVLLLELQAEQDGVHRIERIGSELDVLRARFPDLAFPKLTRAFRPPTAEHLIQAIQAVYDSHRPLRTLVIAHGASDSAEQIQRTRWKALSTWLARHAGSLSPATRAVFDLAGVPDWQTPAERTHAEDEAREKAAATERMLAGLGGEAAKAQVRRGF